MVTWLVPAIMALTSACSTTEASAPRDTWQSGPPPAQPTNSSEHGVVVSASILASQVGARILEEGGNAVDAAVATAFALPVVEPSMSSIGGRTQILIRTSTGEYAGIDGTTQVPAGYRSAAVPPSPASTMGYGTIAIPGTVAALEAARVQYGTLPLAQLLAPAIELAEEGFILTSTEASRFASAARNLALWPGSRKHLLKESGVPYRSGELFRQPVLARTLRRLAERGATDFYQGETARLIAADMAEHGGFVTEADLANYRAEPAIIARGRYRGHELVGTYLPASGATVIQIMQMLELFDLPRMIDSPEWAALVGQAIRIGMEDRSYSVGSARENAAKLTSPEWASERASAIWVPGTPVGQAALGSYDDEFESPHTTHLSVADRAGNLVALTQSIGPSFGSHVVSEELGFVYASTQGYLSSRPGNRPSSSQAPTFMIKEGESVYIFGAAGAAKIVSAIVQAMSRVADGETDFETAIKARRIHPIAGGTIEIEDRSGVTWPTTLDATLRSWDFNTARKTSRSYFGRINGIHHDQGRGLFIGVADPRGGGSAATPRR